MVPSFLKSGFHFPTQGFYSEIFQEFPNSTPAYHAPPRKVYFLAKNRHFPSLLVSSLLPLPVLTVAVLFFRHFDKETSKVVTVNQQIHALYRPSANWQASWLAEQCPHLGRIPHQWLCISVCRLEDLLFSCSTPPYPTESHRKLFGWQFQGLCHTLFLPQLMEKKVPLKGVPRVFLHQSSTLYLALKQQPAFKTNTCLVLISHPFLQETRGS